MKILMNNANGVKLLTGGKKCLEDIEVVPTFKAVEQVQITFLDPNDQYNQNFCVHYTENGVHKTTHIDLFENESVTLTIDKNTLFLAYDCKQGFDDPEFEQSEIRFEDAQTSGECIEQVATGLDGFPALCLAINNGDVYVHYI